MRVLIVVRSASVQGDEGGIEVEVAGGEITTFGAGAALLERTRIENAKNLTGDRVGNVGDELEGVVEGADDEAVVAKQEIVSW